MKKIKKNFNKCFKSLMLSKVKFNDPEGIRSYLTTVNNWLVTQTVKKSKKKFMFFFQYLMLSKVKLNDVETNSW